MACKSHLRCLINVFWLVYCSYRSSFFLLLVSYQLYLRFEMHIIGGREVCATLVGIYLFDNDAFFRPFF